MSEPSELNAEDRAMVPRARVLDLYTGDRQVDAQSPSSGSVRVFARERGACWVSRFTGLDAQLLPHRVFLTNWESQFVEIEGERFYALTYSALEEGFYEARSWVSRDGEGGFGTVYFRFELDAGFSLMSEERYRASLRAAFGVSFGEVRSLAARREWDAADRAARWVEEGTTVDAAREYVWRERARVEGLLPDIEGSSSQVSRASAIRWRALKTLGEHRQGEEPGLPAEIREQARAWLLRHTGSDFWIINRDRLEDGEALWIMFLEGMDDE